MKTAGLRLLWLFALLSLGAVTIGVQLDHASERSPGLRATVPPAFRAVSITSRADGAPTPLSLQNVTDAIRKRPIPAEHIALLSLMLLEQGADAEAGEAMLAAAARGWRVPVAQIYVMRLALAQRNWEVAAQRYDALRRLRSAQIGADDLQQFLADPSGSAALARQVSSRDEWLLDLLREDAGTQDPAAYAHFVEQLRGKGVRMNCSGLRIASMTLLKRQRPAEAIRVWAGDCATGSADPASAKGFGPPDRGAAGPFDWVFPDQPGISRSFAEKAGQWRLQYQNDDPISRPVARRIVAMAPGAHRFELEHGASSGSAGLAAIYCPGASRSLPVEDGQIVVPSSGCPYQNVEIMAPPGAGEIAILIR